MDETVSDAVLAERAVADADAFAVLYRRHLQRVYSYLLSRTGHVQDAQDLTAQTFIAALQGIAGYAPGGSFGAWLIGIARHKAADHFRSSSPMVQLDENTDDVPLPDDGPPLDEVVIQRLQMGEVAALLERLNPERAEALRLRFFGELKMREIAVVMDKSEGAVKMLVARALEGLRKMMQPTEEIR